MAISLVKGQKISLEKEAGGKLSKICMGLGWDVARGGNVDLDASCLMFDSAKNLSDSVWFRQLQSKDGSIRHTGDNVTGEGEGDDEQIIVDLSRVPENVHTLVFTVNSFTGQSFNVIANAFCRMVDQASNKEIARYTLSGGGDYTGQVMAKLYRHSGEWKMAAIGEPSSGRTFQDMLPQIKNFL